MAEFDDNGEETGHHTEEVESAPASFAGNFTSLEKIGFMTLTMGGVAWGLYDIGQNYVTEQTRQGQINELIHDQNSTNRFLTNGTKDMPSAARLEYIQKTNQLYSRQATQLYNLIQQQPLSPPVGQDVETVVVHGVDGALAGGVWLVGLWAIYEARFKLHLWRKGREAQQQQAVAAKIEELDAILDLPNAPNNN